MTTIKFKNIPADIVEKAYEVLGDYESKTTHHRVAKNTKKKVISLEVGYRHRLVNKGSKWELMSHEKYNTYINR